MPKRSFRESLISMLGEFVALNRNPEFRLSPKSSQFLDEAVKTEYERSRTDNIQTLQIMFDELDTQDVDHRRTISAGTGYRPFDLDENERRQSMPSNRKRPSIFGRLKAKKSKKAAYKNNGHRDSLTSANSSISTSSTDSEPYILSIRQ
ncbi:hypothetical protein M3Y97_00046400 [Aphelenchoides bicaudatus]|nr:hypothetical protein M3Y97_00046400 [Aphelenchoides bicaudatus]